MNFLTDFADQAVTLPVAGAVLVVLLAGRWRRGGLAWAGGVAGVLAVMLALKLVMAACGFRLGALATPSPSGHTATAAVVYGGLASLAVRRVGPGAWAALAASAGMAALVGLTRVALGVHTPGDAAVGAAVGVAGAVAMRRAAGPRPAWLPAPRLAAAAVLVAVALHGHHLRAEAGIRSWAASVWPLTLCRR